MAIAAMATIIIAAAIPTYNATLEPPVGPTGCEGDGVMTGVVVGGGVVGAIVGVGVETGDAEGAVSTTK